MCALLEAMTITHITEESHCNKHLAYTVLQCRCRIQLDLTQLHQPAPAVMRLLADVLERRGRRLADLESLGAILVTRHWIESEGQLLQLDRSTWVAMGLPFAVCLPAIHIIKELSIDESFALTNLSIQTHSRPSVQAHRQADRHRTLLLLSQTCLSISHCCPVSHCCTPQYCCE